jgi:hypothetical protein
MENELRQRADEEKNRIVGILTEAGISERRMQMLGPVIDNVSWMKAKLDDSRALIKNSNIVVPYDNGGGQKGIRENPAFRGYEALWKSYMQGMNRILDTLPEEEAKTLDYEDMKPQSVLSLVRDRHRSAV